MFYYQISYDEKIVVFKNMLHGNYLTINLTYEIGFKCIFIQYYFCYFNVSKRIYK